MEQPLKIKSIEHLTHDVLRIRTAKPDSIAYIPGQAADISINKPGWEKELRAFTFTSLEDDDFVEFTIKTYPARKGVTNELLTLKPGNELLFHGVFGDIQYKGEGIFLAGGAGITPFIAILKDLERQNKIGNNKLIFANKTKSDIILPERFNQILGKNFINVLSDEEISGFEHGYVNADLIKKYTAPENKYYYLCGPPPMMDAVEKHLASIGVAESNIVREGF